MTDTQARPPRWTAYMPLTDVLRAPRNPKNHATHILRASMERFGVVELPALDERTGRLVAGHGRLDEWSTAHAEGRTPPDGVQLDAETGEWLVPVSRGWASGDDAEAEGYLITSNQSVILGGWDEHGLDTMLADIAREDFQLAQITGTSAGELEALLEASEPEQALPPLPSMQQMIDANREAFGDQPGNGYAHPATEAPWMTQTAPQYTPPDGTALTAAHRATYGDDVIEHDTVPATGATYAETPEQEAARADRIAAYKSVTTGGLVEMILVYTQDDRQEAARLIADARRVLGADLKGSEVMLRGLRVLMAVLDGRDSADTVELRTLARHAGWTPDE